jgi:predicted SnoaL-like aldol condensation-catalyzing enzyme
LSPAPSEEFPVLTVTLKLQYQLLDQEGVLEMSKTNKEIVQGFFDQVINQKRMDAFDDYFSKDYVSHSPPYIGMGLSTQNTDDKMFVSSIAPGGPADGKLQVGDEIIRVEDEYNLWDTFEQLNTAVLGIGKTGTAIKVRVLRGEASFDYEITRGLIEAFDISYAAVKENYRAFLTDQYPDVKVKVIKMIAEGDTVACYTVTQGINSDFDREAIWADSAFYRLSNGKIVEEWYVSDYVMALKQLGYDIKAPEV